MAEMVKARTSPTISRLKCMVVEYDALSMSDGRVAINRG